MTRAAYEYHRVADHTVGRGTSIEECELCHSSVADAHEGLQPPRQRLWIKTVGETRLYNYALGVDLGYVLDNFM